MSAETLAAAREYVAMGMSVLPIRAKSKLPAIAAWKPLQDRIPTDAELARWFGTGTHRNIALICGRVSGIVAVDIDSPTAESWAADHLPASPLGMRTRKGRHAFYRYPGEPIGNRVRIRADGGAIDLDVRGDGGYVIAAPSIHPSGVAYQRIGDWTREAVQALPVFDPLWLAEPEPEAPTARVERPAPPPGRLDVRERASRYLAAAEGAVAGSGGHNTTYRVVSALVHGFQLGEADALELLAREYNPRCSPPWSERELRHKIASAITHGPPPDRQAGWLLGPAPTATPDRRKPHREATPPPSTTERLADHEAEQGLLAAVMIHPPAADALRELGASSLASPAHVAVAEAMLRVLDGGRHLDTVSLRGALEAIGALDQPGVRGSLDALRSPTGIDLAATDNIADRLRDLATRRDLRGAAARLMAESACPTERAVDLAARASQEIGALAERGSGDTARTLGAVLDEALSRSRAGIGAWGWPTTVGRLASLVPLFREGELVIVAGRPSHGKSCLMRRLACDAAPHGVVVVASLEESSSRFAEAVIASEAGIAKARVASGQLYQHEWAEIDAARERLACEGVLDRVVIEECPKITPARIQALARKWSRRHGAGSMSAVIVDYLQLLDGGEPSKQQRGAQNRHLELGAITRAFKLLARELRCPVIVGSQLSRASQHGAGIGSRRPRLADLRDSGAIEADADVVIGVFNWRVESAGDEWSHGVVELHVLKQRMGPPGRTIAAIDGACVTELRDPEKANDYTERARLGRGI